MRRALSWAFWIRSVAGLTFRSVWLKYFTFVRGTLDLWLSQNQVPQKLVGLLEIIMQDCVQNFFRKIYTLTRSLKVNFTLWTQHSDSAKVKSNPPHSCETQSQEIKPNHMRECFIATLQFNKECDSGMSVLLLIFLLIEAEMKVVTCFMVLS